MKPKLLFAIAVITFMFTACSNDEPDIPDVTNIIDYDYMNSLTHGTEYGGYDLKSWSMNYSGGSLQDANEKRDPNSLPLHQKIYFLHGKICFQLDLKSIEGYYHPLFYPLELYRWKKKFEYQYVISAPANIGEDKKITINDKEYKILSISKDGIRMYYQENLTSSYYTSASKNYIINYEKLNLSNIDTDKFLYYDSRTEALLDIVRMLRAYFGDSVDVNQMFDPQYGLLNSVYNLKKIEENILAGNDWSLEGVCSKPE